METARQLERVAGRAWIGDELASALLSAGHLLLKRAEERSRELEAAKGQTFLPGCGPGGR